MLSFRRGCLREHLLAQSLGKGGLALLGEGSKRRFAPLIKWPGGKSLEWPLVEEYVSRHVPRFDRYFEPFCGGAAVFWGLSPSVAYLNDSCVDLINFYREVQQQSPVFFSALEAVAQQQAATPESMEGLYYRAREAWNRGECASTSQAAAGFFILREYAYGGMFRYNASGAFNVPFGKAYVSKPLSKKITRLREASTVEPLKSACFSKLDFEEFLGKSQLGEKDFIFLDPPYDCAFSSYSNNKFGKKDQERLAHYLRDCPACFVLLSQKTPFIKQLYKPFHQKTYPFRYRFNIRGRNPRKVEHLLISNC